MNLISEEIAPVENVHDYRANQIMTGNSGTFFNIILFFAEDVKRNLKQFHFRIITFQFFKADFIAYIILHIVLCGMDKIHRQDIDSKIITWICL